MNSSLKLWLNFEIASSSLLASRGFVNLEDLAETDHMLRDIRFELTFISLFDAYIKLSNLYEIYKSKYYRHEVISNGSYSKTTLWYSESY